MQGKKRQIIGCSPNTGIIGNMNKAEIKEIDDYVKELFESLYEWDYGELSWQVELPKLHKTIEGVAEMLIISQVFLSSAVVYWR